MGARTTSPPSEPSSPREGGIRKRVCKACDRCRLKKSKCDGSSPCSRCRADNAICVFGERKKSHDKVYPKGYVEMLESQQSQLVTGLQELYRRLLSGGEWTGSPLKETSQGIPLTHDILERLGALDGEHGDLDHFEENTDILQRKLLANGAGFMQRDYSFDNNSEVDQSPVFEPMAYQNAPGFTNPFANRFGPTPPSGSPHTSPVKTSSPLKAEMAASLSQPLPQSQWPVEPMNFDGLDFNMAYDSSMFEASMQATGLDASMYSNPTGAAINPCLTMKDWFSLDQLNNQYNQGGIYT